MTTHYAPLDTNYAPPTRNTGGARSQFIKEARKAIENYRAGLSATEGMERLDRALDELMRKTRGHD